MKYIQVRKYQKILRSMFILKFNNNNDKNTEIIYPEMKKILNMFLGIKETIKYSNNMTGVTSFRKNGPGKCVMQILYYI
jgi:hypothetical protein